MTDNNNTTTNTNMDQPTMLDLFNLIAKCATKEDIGDISSRINIHVRETNEKMQNINTNLEVVAMQASDNSDRIEMLEANIEQLKQDQLKNNLCISGVPPGLINGDNTSDIVIKIASKLNVEITRNQFSSYAVANNKFIIVRFYNIKYKQMMQNKIRVKRSLMVEEIFTNTSNSQIYLNDHLTPYWNKLYLMARTAKKDGKLASATSHGGKIRARKSTNDAPITITHEKMLFKLIHMEYDDTSTESIQHNDDSIASNASASTSTSRQINTKDTKNQSQKNKDKTNELKQQKPRRNNKPGTSKTITNEQTSSDTNKGTKRKRGSAGSEQSSPKKLKE